MSSIQEGIAAAMGALGAHWADCTYPDDHCKCEFGLFDIRKEAARIARNFTPSPAVETVTLAALAEAYEPLNEITRSSIQQEINHKTEREECRVNPKLMQRVLDQDAALAQLLAAVPPSEHPTVDEGACRCTMLTAQTPWEPADWEQADDCPVHPLAAPPAPHGDSGLRGIALDATRSAYHDDPEVLSTSLTRVANALVQHIAAHPEVDA